MKRVLKFLFNAARTLSLILILGLLGLSFYLSLDEQRERDFYQALEKYEDRQAEFSGDDSDDEMRIMAIDEPALSNYEAQKVQIPVKGGSAYLRPSQIMYIHAGSPVTIVMNNDSTIATTESLTRLDRMLQDVDGGYFFRTKSTILNCSYVLQFTREGSEYRGRYTYQHVAKMEDGEQINVSKEKADELSELLDNLTF
ncbi:LytTR family transcriptional regulator DNA-binding domain-containing protein [Lewinella sp. LCG006]|uniref:LytTR family transcriptional regulator DNA-binding domain-containing protein n=1 Tax=Lewinella sp. LCG006 TaxID=3231911 RepID=UPI003460BF12